MKKNISDFWFEVKLRHSSPEGDGKKVTETFLIASPTFGGAEAYAVQAIQQFYEDLEVLSVKKTNYAEALEYSADSDDVKWYRVRISLISLNEATGKEKKTRVNYLFAALSTSDAEAEARKFMNSSMQDYVIEAIVETSILDVYLASL